MYDVVMISTYSQERDVIVCSTGAVCYPKMLPIELLLLHIPMILPLEDLGKQSPIRATVLGQT
jgi:hypothetical protein